MAVDGAGTGVEPDDEFGSIPASFRAVQVAPPVRLAADWAERSNGPVLATQQVAPGGQQTVTPTELGQAHNSAT